MQVKGVTSKAKHKLREDPSAVPPQHPGNLISVRVDIGETSPSVDPHAIPGKAGLARRI